MNGNVKIVKFIRRVKRRITRAVHKVLKYGMGCIYACFAPFIPVDPRKVLFFSFQNGYACNPKYIHRALAGSNSGWKMSWVVDQEDQYNDLPEDVQVVRRGTAKYYRELYSSGIWIDNALNVQKLPVKRKKDQFYLQTMHGSLGIKRIGTNASNSKMQKRREEKSMELTNVAISNSTFETEVYRTSFWRNAEVIGFESAELVKKNPDRCYIMELGHARSDVLIQSQNDPEKTREIRERVCKHYGLDPEKKIVLWGPTFEESTQNLCEPDYEAFCSALKARFGGDWIVMYRLHPRDEKRRKRNAREAIQSDDRYLIDGSQYMDIQELMIAADFAVTNYSSWIFDYLLTGKPGMLFVPDVESYSNSTGFYYPIDSTPLPVVKDNKEAVSAIRDFDPVRYQSDIQKFIQARGCIDDGYAAQRIAELAGILID